MLLSNMVTMIATQVSLIEALGHPIGVVVGLLDAKVEEESLSIISLNASCVDGLVILYRSAIINLMRLLKVFLISLCRCIVISSKALPI